MSNSQLDKLKSKIKSGTRVTLNLLLNLIGNSNDESYILHKSLLTNTQFSEFQDSKLLQMINQLI